MSEERGPDAGDGSDDGRAGAGRDGPDGGDPVESLPGTDDADVFDSLPEVDGEDPFERLDEGDGDSDGAGGESGDALGERTPADGTDPFERMDAGADPDADASWEELVSSDEPDDGTVDPTTVGETVVPKRQYCQDCEYFTAPPEVACTHADGRILEAVDIDHFRVWNCPVVAHRRGRSVHGDGGVGADD